MKNLIWNLLAELTASHFGGGGGLLRKKSAGEHPDDEGGPKAKSRQELIEELIHKSKQEKVSRLLTHGSHEIMIIIK